MQKTDLYDRNTVAPNCLLASRSPRKPVEELPQQFRLLTKTLLVMKLTLLFLIAGLFHAQAKTFSQTITFSGKSVAITKVFKSIEEQTGYTVFANKDLLKDIKPVSLSVKDMPLNDFLSTVLLNQPVGFEIHNKTIFITVKKNGSSTVKTNEPAIVIEAPPFIEIKGAITGAEGAPLQGATIVIKGTRTSVMTDAEGRFTINALPSQTLIISYVGYQTKEVSLGGRTSIDVVLEKSGGEIEQVVVTALGIPKRVKTLTYNVQEIKGDDISGVNNGNFANSLVGKVAGATINSSSAGTGASTRLVFRGAKSLFGNNNALYVIDGIPMPNNIRGQAEDIFQEPDRRAILSLT